MSTLRGQPPGRAGLPWLRHRLGLAERAAARLDQKLRILRTEQAAAAAMVARTGPEWHQACREAESWLLKAALVGGQEALCSPPGLSPARVDIDWTTSLGATYPARGGCSVPEPDPGQALVAPAAVVQATRAHARALEAAVEHGAAAAAARAIDAEVATTRQRLRGVQDRWMPRLTEALASLRIDLDETEHAEGIRLRWAADREGGGR